MVSDVEIEIPAKNQLTGEIVSNRSEKSSNMFKNVKEWATVFLTASPVFWLIVFIIAIISALPLTQLIIGTLYKNDCPINHLIPIYLIVAGVSGLVTIIIGPCMLSLQMIMFLAFDTHQPYYQIPILILLLLFKFAWFVAGNIWIFRASRNIQFFDSTNTQTYCDRGLFNGAFLIIIIEDVFVGLFVCWNCR